VHSAVEELDRVSDLCAQLDLAVAERDLVGRVLEPIAALVGADTASLRRFGLANGATAPLAIVSTGIPGSVREAYLDRYFALDPVRRLLVRRRLDKPLFDDPARRGEWSTEDASPATRAAHRDEFRRYRREFLLPNHFYHHVGFCVQDAAGGMLVLDFHRPAGAAEFGAIERARARVVAGYLHAKAGAKRAGAAQSGETDVELTSREMQVAEAVAIGLSNKQVAESLGISVRTVENHLRSIFAKCNVTTRTRLAARLREPSALRT
jgi:DNA-binding CsgD family transcriptional regulator